MGRLLLAGLLAGLTASWFRWRGHSWRYAILPAVWVAVVSPVLASVHSYTVQLLGFVLMFAGARALDRRSDLRTSRQDDLAEAASPTAPHHDMPRKRGEADVLRLLGDESLTADQQYEYLSELLKVAADRSSRVRAESPEVPVLSSKCTAVLERTLGSQSVKVRRVSIDLLEKIGGEQEADLIASALGSDTGLTVWKAAAALLDIGRRDRAILRRLLPELVRCLDGESGNLEPKDRYTVVRAISSARTPEMVGVLGRCAVEPDVLVRKAAAEGLFAIGTRDAYDALQAAVKQLSLLKGRHARRCLWALKLSGD